MIFIYLLFHTWECVGFRLYGHYSELICQEHIINCDINLLIDLITSNVLR